MRRFDTFYPVARQRPLAKFRLWPGPGIREADAMISSVGAMHHTPVFRRLDTRWLGYSGLRAAVPLPTTIFPTRPLAVIDDYKLPAAKRTRMETVTLACELSCIPCG